MKLTDDTVSYADAEIEELDRLSLVLDSSKNVDFVIIIRGMNAR